MKNCYLITSYCNTELKVEILNECISNLKDISDFDICVHAHYPLDVNIQNNVNYYLYDYSNPIFNYPEKYMIFWKKVKNYTQHIYTSDYGYTVLQQWKRGFDFLKNLYDNIIILNYDVFLDKYLLNKLINKNNYEGCSFLQENGNTLSAISSIKTSSKLFDKISKEEYLKLDVIAEDFVKYIYSNSNSYFFKFDEYKDHYYTSIDFDGTEKFKNNYIYNGSPYNSLKKFYDFELFVSDSDSNLLSIFFYNIKNILDVKIIYKDYNYYRIINDDILIVTNIKFDENFDINKLNIIVNNDLLNFNREIVKICKIIENV